MEQVQNTDPQAEKKVLLILSIYIYFFFGKLLLSRQQGDFRKLLNAIF